MGCDIHGWIEYQEIPGDWDYHAVIRLSEILTRSYDIFGLLFGVRNSTGLEPIAYCRGLPKDVSKEVKKDAEEWDSDGHSHTFVTLAELEAYDWEKDGLDERVRQYGQSEVGEWKPEMKFAFSSDLTYQDHTAMRRGEPVNKGGKRYQFDRLKAKTIREGQLDRIIRHMRLLAENCWLTSSTDEGTPPPPAERVRMVVWFDN